MQNGHTSSLRKTKFRLTDMVVPMEFTPQIGNLVLFLNVTKERITDSVANLAKKDLDHVHDSSTPTIGTFLKHIAAVENWFRILTFERRALNEKEKEFWDGSLPLQLLDRKVHGNSLTYYLDLWRKVRKRTLNEFKRSNDDWLYIRSGEFNNYFAWYHVMEDHLSHLGQIKSIISRIEKRYEKP